MQDGKERATTDGQERKYFVRRADRAALPETSLASEPFQPENGAGTSALAGASTGTALAPTLVFESERTRPVTGDMTGMVERAEDDSGRRAVDGMRHAQETANRADSSVPPRIIERHAERMALARNLTSGKEYFYRPIGAQLAATTRRLFEATRHIVDMGSMNRAALGPEMSETLSQRIQAEGMTAQAYKLANDHRELFGEGIAEQCGRTLPHTIQPETYQSMVDVMAAFQASEHSRAVRGEPQMQPPGYAAEVFATVNSAYPAEDFHGEGEIDPSAVPAFPGRDVVRNLLNVYDNRPTQAPDGVPIQLVSDAQVLASMKGLVGFGNLLDGTAEGTENLRDDAAEILTQDTPVAETVVTEAVDNLPYQVFRIWRDLTEGTVRKPIDADAARGAYFHAEAFLKSLDEAEEEVAYIDERALAAASAYKTPFTQAYEAAKRIEAGERVPVDVFRALEEEVKDDDNIAAWWGGKFEVGIPPATGENNETYWEQAQAAAGRFVSKMNEQAPSISRLEQEANRIVDSTDPIEPAMAYQFFRQAQQAYSFTTDDLFDSFQDVRDAMDNGNPKAVSQERLRDFAREVRSVLGPRIAQTEAAEARNKHAMDIDREEKTAALREHIAALRTNVTAFQQAMRFENTPNGPRRMDRAYVNSLDRVALARNYLGLTYCLPEKEALLQEALRPFGEAIRPEALLLLQLDGMEGDVIVSRVTNPNYPLRNTPDIMTRAAEGSGAATPVSRGMTVDVESAIQEIMSSLGAHHSPKEVDAMLKQVDLTTGKMTGAQMWFVARMLYDKQGLHKLPQYSEMELHDGQWSQMLGGPMTDMVQQRVFPYLPGKTDIVETPRHTADMFAMFDQVLPPAWESAGRGDTFIPPHQTGGKAANWFARAMNLVDAAYLEKRAPVNQKMVDRLSREATEDESLRDPEQVYQQLAPECPSGYPNPEDDPYHKALKRLINPMARLKALQPDARTDVPPYLRRKLAPLAENESRSFVLVGPLGAGKSYMVEMVAQHMGIPWTLKDASAFAVPPYVGYNLQGVDDEGVKNLPQEIIDQYARRHKCSWREAVERNRRHLLVIDEPQVNDAGTEKMGKQNDPKAGSATAIWSMFLGPLNGSTMTPILLRDEVDQATRQPRTMDLDIGEWGYFWTTSLEGKAKRRFMLEKGIRDESELNVSAADTLTIFPDGIIDRTGEGGVIFVPPLDRPTTEAFYDEKGKRMIESKLQSYINSIDTLARKGIRVEMTPGARDVLIDSVMRAKNPSRRIIKSLPQRLINTMPWSSLGNRVQNNTLHITEQDLLNMFTAERIQQGKI